VFSAEYALYIIIINQRRRKGCKPVTVVKHKLVVFCRHTKHNYFDNTNHKAENRKNQNFTSDTLSFEDVFKKKKKKNIFGLVTKEFVLLHTFEVFNLKNHHPGCISFALNPAANNLGSRAQILLVLSGCCTGLGSFHLHH
jgi:hypothetical protein